MWDGFGDLGEEYDFFDEEIDAVVDEAIRPPRRPPTPPPPFPFLAGLVELLGYAENSIDYALGALNSGAPLAEVLEHIGDAIRYLAYRHPGEIGATRLIVAEIRRIGDRNSPQAQFLRGIIRLISRAIRLVRSAQASRNVGVMATALREAREAVRRARRALGLPLA
jgi:hypothetical protein